MRFLSWAVASVDGVLPFKAPAGGLPKELWRHYHRSLLSIIFAANNSVKDNNFVQIIYFGSRNIFF